jgi:hypothetical protein
VESINTSVEKVRKPGPPPRLDADGQASARSQSTKATPAPLIATEAKVAQPLELRATRRTGISMTYVSGEEAGHHERYGDG